MSHHFDDPVAAAFEVTLRGTRACRHAFKARGAALVTLMTLACGCDSKPEQPARATSSRAEVSASAASPAPTVSSSSATSAADAGKPPFAGTWQADFAAKRGSVSVPAGAPDATWADDAEEEAIGEGSMVLVVGADGQVSGSASGALGKLTVRGMLEDETLRAGLAPAKPDSEDAMTGVLVGKLDGDVIAAQLRVSSGDARLARAATLRLERQQPSR